jgi:hypothetical protein
MAAGCARDRGPVHVPIADRVWVVPAVRITARFPAWWLMRNTSACVKGVFDPLADGVFMAVGAVHVNLVQDTGAACPVLPDMTALLMHDEQCFLPAR